MNKKQKEWTGTNQNNTSSQKQGEKTDLKNPEVGEVDNDVTGKTIFVDNNKEEIYIFDDNNSVDLMENEGQELVDADEQDQVGDGEDNVPPTSSRSRRRKSRRYGSY